MIIILALSMSLKNKTGLIALIIIMYASSCANKTSPTGGPRDETPPALIVTSPKNESLNFEGQNIILEFDEYIKLDNPKEEIIITPRLLGEYEISYKKNKVTLKIEDSLQANTTYTFSFRESIKDLNEANAPENLQLAFSTGDYLDSLSIEGNVFRLLTNKPKKNIAVSLYEASDTLDLFNSPPIYFTKTNDKGDFKFNNLKNGEYKIFAINDKNKNLTLESKTEEYGFLDKNINLDSNIVDIKLRLINLDVSPLKMQSARTRGHYFVLKYNKYISSYSQKTLVSDKDIPATSISEDHREIKYYNPNTIADSLGIIINTYDTINNLTTDTVYVKFEETKRKRDKFEFTTTKISIDKIDPKIATEVAFTKPISIINFDSLYFQIDSTTQISFDSSDLKWNKNKTLLTITKSFDPELFIKPEQEKSLPDTTMFGKKSISKGLSTEDKSLSSKDTKDISSKPSLPKKNNDTRLYMGISAFQSIEQDSSIYKVQKVSFTNPSTTGSLLIKIETSSKNYYTQLINNKGEVVFENYSNKEFSFDNTLPGKYTIRILVDENGNGIWDIGDITKNIVPEQVYFYISEEGTSEITIRANWVLGPNIIKF